MKLTTLIKIYINAIYTMIRHDIESRTNDHFMSYDKIFSFEAYLLTKHADE
jgi:hypothetical protein